MKINSFSSNVIATTSFNWLNLLCWFASCFLYIVHTLTVRWLQHWPKIEQYNATKMNIILFDKFRMKPNFYYFRDSMRAIVFNFLGFHILYDVIMSYECCKTFTTCHKWIYCPSSRCVSSVVLDFLSSIRPKESVPFYRFYCCVRSAFGH